jgi:SAM-dependent methyltransferase
VTDHSPYDAIADFGALYDSVPIYQTRPDVAFYVPEARRSGGRVLELGCGTGRILLPIAREGIAIAGLDGSREMLARCEARLAAEPEEVRARVTLHRADVRDFDLGTTFDLVIAPFRIMQHLHTIDDQLAFLAGVARHLAPGGRLVFDVFNPNFGALVGADGTEHEDADVELPGGGRLRRTARITGVRWIDQVSQVELIYYLRPSLDAPEQRHVQAFGMRWYGRAELEHLLARGGFRATAVHSDWNGGPLTDASPEQIVVAERV